MEYKIVNKPAFSVIGRQGSTEDGEGFIARLWQEANENFPEVAALAKRGPEGSFAGFWGLMSDEGMNFMPWEDGFTRGLYLARNGGLSPSRRTGTRPPGSIWLPRRGRRPSGRRWNTSRSRAGPSRGRSMTSPTPALGNQASIFPLTKRTEMRYHYDRGDAQALP